MVPNSAGGNAYPVDGMTLLRRFPILGSEGGSYYSDERKLTLENTAAVKRCITASEDSGIDAVGEIINISGYGRAPKPGPPLFALAMAASYGSDVVRWQAFNGLQVVARTGSQLQMFVDFIGTMRGWGRGLRRAVAHWYLDKPVVNAAYQAVKYRSRYNWTHRDLLRKAHPKARAIDEDRDTLFAWIDHGTPVGEAPSLALVRGYEAAKTASVERLVELIDRHNLTWEMVPAEMLKEKEVWAALSKRMPLTALLRNLATLTRLSVIAPMESAWVCSKLIFEISRQRERPIHPIAILSALLTYRAGKGARGHHTWTPVPQVVDTLDHVFDKSFATAPQTNKRLYLGIDVSGSMGSGEVAGVPGLTPRMAAAAMAMAIARREPNYYMAGFAAGAGPDTGTSIRSWGARSNPRMAPLDITASDSLAFATQKAHSQDFGATDCALPMLDAMDRGIPVDCFMVVVMVELALHRGRSPRSPTGRLA